MKKYNFIFDFDGTIANSYDLIFNLYNSLAPGFNMPTLDERHREPLKNAHYKTVLRLLGHHAIKLPKLVHALKNELAQHIHLLKPHEGIPDTLATLHQQAHTLYILSANRQSTIQQFIQQHELDYFDAIIEVPTLSGKAGAIKRTLKRHALFPTQTYYIGDEVRDIDAANTAGINAIAVTWGYNSKACLQRQHPAFMINSPQELLTLPPTHPAEPTKKA